MYCSLVDSFKGIVEKCPDAEAILHNGLRHSYQDIFKVSCKVSAFLTEHGLQPGDRVAMLVSNSPEYVGIYYGVLSAGGVVVSLNTQSKSKDVLNWLKHSSSNWLFVEKAYTDYQALKSTTDFINVVTLHDEGEDASQARFSWASVINNDGQFNSVEPKENDLASIIYTSGTTGHPKGVTLSHGNLAANIQSIQDYLELTQHDSIVNVLPFYYSYGNSVLHTHITVGARLVLENSLLYPHNVVKKIEDESVTGFSGVPSTFALLLGRVDLQKYNLSSLRYITQAGGPMAPALTDRLGKEIPAANLFIMYGQTEATARLTYLPPKKLREKKGSIGIPIPGVSIEVRGKDHKKVGVGDTGEICAHGHNIMQGYWRDAEKTQSVIKDGWLYTGDLAHYDEEGYLYIVGRSSDMIKSGANRISPKGIEEVIQELPEVQEVCVIGVPDDLMGEVIKAFIVIRSDMSADKKTILGHCKKNLATYKIPKSIEFVDDLPKTASGKIQKFKLRDMGYRS